MPLRRFKNNNKAKPARKREWKSCVDPKSGKTYYYDVRTRETQWTKPMELASQSERCKIEEKEAKQREFFRSMESNILRALDSGTVPGRVETQEDEVKDLPKRANLTRAKKPILVRTISSMDDNVLAELAQDDDVDGTMAEIVSPDCTATSFFASLPQPEVHHPLKNHSPPPASFNGNTPFGSQAVRVTPPQDGQSKALRKPALEKRNTCGSLYISNTMSDPDVEATIKCVCGVFRTHIVQSLNEYSFGAKFEDYEVFNDDYRDRTRRTSTHLVESEMSIEMMRIDCVEDDLPTLDEITDFYRFIFKKAQMENDCIVISLIYVERLMRETNGGVRPNIKNWRSVLFSAMILSSKVWDDLSMWNADFTLACPEGVTFSLQRINELELALLTCFKYNVKVPASEYAKYYFLIRSLLIRSGLVGQDVLSSKKLDIEGAQKLESLSSNYKSPKPSIVRRAQSANVPNRSYESARSGHVSLEQVVRM